MNLSYVGSCCSIHLGCNHLRRYKLPIDRTSYSCNTAFRDALFPGCGFVHLNVRSGRRLFELFRRRGFSGIVGLTTRTKIQCSVDGPCTCVRDGLRNFLGVLRTYQCCKMGRLVFTSSDSICNVGAGIPFDRSSGISAPIDLCTTDGGSGRLVTRTCDGLCNFTISNLHCFAICNP